MDQNNPIMQSRYGQKTTSKLGLRITAVVGIAIIMGYAAWIAIANATDLSFQDVGFSIKDPWHAVVEYEISKPTDESVICQIEVLNEQFAIVGYREVLIGPGAVSTQRFQTTVNTTELGVTGLVKNCQKR